MAGTPRDIPYLESKFQTDDVPTQQDFYDLFASFIHYLQVKQETGNSTTDVMSQKAVSDALTALTRNLDQVLTVGNSANGKRITNLLDPVGAQDADTKAARDAAIATAIANLINSAPGALDTLNELATALGDDPNFASTITNALALKAPLASPGLTGIPTAPTAELGTNTTQIATTQFVVAAIAAIVVAIANQAEAETASDATLGNRENTKAFTARSFRWAWDKMLTMATQFSSTLRGAELLSANQAAASGKRNMLAIDDTGKLIKTTWAEVDETNKKITKTGLNNLSTVLEEWKNSDGTTIFQIFNDLSSKFGGTSHLLKVNAGVASGAAKFEFLNNLNLAYIFGTLGQNFVEFISTTGDQAIRIKVRLITEYVGSVYYEVHLEATVTATAGGVTVIGSFPASVGKIYNVRSSWVISETGGESGGASVENTIKNAGGTTSAIGAQSATHRRSLGDWTANILANNTSDTIDFSFTNSSASNQKAYKVNIVAHIHETDLA